MTPQDAARAMQTIANLMLRVAEAAENNPALADALAERPPFTRDLTEEAQEYLEYAERLAEADPVKDADPSATRDTWGRF